ncbi:MAG: SH3 domain-containing protein [Actinomycetia bacterium]|nr:SH3 domain-containing protein [Actinomycetes bacterium]MCP4222715.1 SH3 domain-containing protein [Actinomycetes bacterium]MCP5032146.1 SH3 domain-containing protein [Actinomycetes bacterium]
MSDLHRDHHDGPGDGLAETASALSRALADRAAEVEPNPNAYANLAAKVNATSPRRGGFGSGWSLGRIGAATVAGVAMVGAGVGIVAIAFDNDNTGDAFVEVADGTTIASDLDDDDGDAIGGDLEVENTSSTLSIPAVPSGIEQIPATGDMISDLTLARSSQTQAVEAFFDLLGIEFVDYEIQGERVSVWTFHEESTERGIDVATLELVPVELDEGPGWIVGEAVSDHVVIERPTPSVVLSGQSELIISGRGTGFEATVGIDLVSATDGSTLVATYANAGSFGELEAFETAIPLVGTERAWVVATSSGGADGVAEPFAAVPVSYEGAVDDTDYVVVRIRDDDPDEGLNLRTGPGASSPWLATIPRGETVTRLPGAFPTLSGTAVWWPVEAGGTEGWVASAFLADPGSEPDDAYVDELSNVLWALADPERIDSGFPILPAHGFTLFNGDSLVKMTAQEILDGDFWGAHHSELGRSPVDVVGIPPSGGDAEQEITVNQPRFIEPASQRRADGYFGGLPYATTTYEGTDGITRRTHVFFATGADGRLGAIGAIVEQG